MSLFMAHHMSSHKFVPPAPAGPFMGVWSLGVSLPVAKGALGSAGTPTDNLVVGGQITGAVAQNTTHRFNGASWTAVAVLPTAKTRISGCGTAADGLYVSGTATYWYNSTVWSTLAVNTVNPGMTPGLFGLKTAAVLAGGGAANAVTLPTQKFNGNAWSAAGNLVTGRIGTTACGTATAGLLTGGYNSTNAIGSALLPAVGTEKYNGTAWSTGPAAARKNSSNSVTGIQTAALLTGGSPLYFSTARTEVFDGTAWTAGNNLCSISGEAVDTSSAGIAIHTSVSSGSSSALLTGGAVLSSSYQSNTQVMT